MPTSGLAGRSTHPLWYFSANSTCSAVKAFFPLAAALGAFARGDDELGARLVGVAGGAAGVQDHRADHQGGAEEDGEEDRAEGLDGHACPSFPSERCCRSRGARRPVTPRRWDISN